MLKLFVTAAALVVAVFSFGCGSGGPANSATNAAANSNTAVKIDTANMPEGINPNPITPSANSTPIPGIPANLSPLPKGATPTPGIPDPETLKKGMKPGLTPTPGIPSPEQLRKQMGQKPPDVNAPAKGDQMMKKNTNKLPPTPH